MRSERSTIAEAVEGFEKIRLSLAIFSQEKNMARAEPQFSLIDVPEVGDPYLFECHLWLLHRHDNVEIIGCRLGAQCDRTRRTAELYRQLLAVHNPERILQMSQT